MSNDDRPQAKGKLAFQLFYHPWRVLGIAVVGAGSIAALIFAALKVMR
jgi:hypothetical protein